MPDDNHQEAGKSTAARALEQILGLIAHGAPGPGKQLPAERELALQLGVSRGSVREATSALVSLGVLDARHGSGVYVTSLEPEHLTAGLRLVLPVAGEAATAELMAVQAMLEGSAAGLAAARVDIQRLDELSVLADEAALALTPRAAAAADRALHRLIADLAGNSMLGALADALVRLDTHVAAWREALRDGGAAQALHADHAAIIGALRARDPEAARSRAAAHSAALAALSRKDAAAAPALSRPKRQSRPPAEQAATATSQEIATDTAARPAPDWYRDAKLGVLVHWGLYSIPGWAPLDETLVELLTDAESSPHDGDGEPDPLVNQPFAEWYQNSLAIEGSPVWHYHRATYGSRGYPSFRGPFASMLGDWDPAAWAELFGAAGARYAIQVAKHHDGFLLWPSSQPHPHLEGWAVQRDLIGDTAAAVRGAGLRYGIYYSSGVDWSFDNLPIRRLVDAHASCPPGAQYAGYVDAHWRELLDRYEPSVLWNDMGHPRHRDLPRLFRDYYRRVPDGIVNDRFTIGADPAGPAIATDVETPNFARRHALRAGAWEMVRPVGISFGWNRQESKEHTLSGGQLVRLLIDVISKDGNLLLGVSPDDRGQVPQLQQRSLRALGAWLERHGEAVYGTRPWTRAESTTVDGVPVRFTTKDGDLYVHLLGATGRQVVVDGLYLQFRSRVHDLTAGRAVQHMPGRHGAVLEMPELLNPAPVRVLRIHPCPPPIDG